MCDEAAAILPAEDADDLAHLRSFIAKLNLPENAKKFWTELMTPQERAAVDRAIEGPARSQRAGFDQGDGEIDF
jgi:hypothetical protein